MKCPCCNAEGGGEYITQSSQAHKFYLDGKPLCYLSPCPYCYDKLKVSVFKWVSWKWKRFSDKIFVRQYE